MSQPNAVCYWSRDYSLRRVATQKGILLTTYGMVLHNSEALGLAQFTKHSLRDSDDKLCWDFMILDEVTVADAEVLQHLTRLLNCDRGCWTYLLATQKCSYCMLRYVAAALFYVTKKIPQLALLYCGLFKAE